MDSPKESSASDNVVSVLFFSRGRGRGHAIPDIAILQKLLQKHSNLEVSFASYSTGYKTFLEQKENIIDLRLPERNDFLETLVCAANLIAERRPNIVISHEEFAVAPAARISGVPVLFIVDWFTESSSLPMKCLDHAEAVIFIEKAGVFPEPPFLKDRVHYTGPVIRPFFTDSQDREKYRLEIGVLPEHTVISVIPGSWANENRVPIADLLINAFDKLPIDGKNLVWVAGSDFEHLSNRFSGRADITFFQDAWPIERLIVASDIVVTKANRGTTYEAAALGVPSVSLSFGLNPIDDIIVSRISSNLPLHARGLSSSYLAQCLQDIAKASSSHSTRPVFDGLERAADAISEQLESILKTSW